MGVIYKVTNTINNKVYIGQTVRDFSRRKTEHINQAKNNHKSCAYFHSALLKYGFEAFHWEIIFESQDTALLNEKEAEFIQKYNAYGEGGYNLCLGGNSNSGYKHSKETVEKRKKFKHSQKTKDEARKRQLGKVLSDNTKEKIKQANLGKKASKKTKEKMSKNGKGKGVKAVICIETGITYDSLTEAAKAIPCSIGALSRAIKENKTIKNFTFKRC